MTDVSATAPDTTWHYTGDMDLENGGIFFRLDDFGDAPASAMNGCAWAVSVEKSPGEEDTWMIRYDGHVFVDEKNMASALDTCGYALADGGISTPIGIETGPESRILMVDAFHAYRGIEGDAQEYVTQADLDERGMSLEAYVRKEFLGAPDCIILKNDPDEVAASSPGF